MSNITVVIPTYNEAKRICQTLENLKGVGELLIIDNYSTDETVALARKYTQNIFLRKNPGWFTPDCYRFRFSLVKTEYVLMAYAGQFYPARLLDLYSKIAEERKFQAVSKYMLVYSYGVHAAAFGRPFESSGGGFAFFNKNAVDPEQGRIHEELPYRGDASLIYMPPRRLDYCIHTFRDDDCDASDSKHARYSSAEARARYAAGERMGIARFFYRMIRHVFGLLFVRGALFHGLIGVIPAVWRIYYYAQVYIKIWELQNGHSRDSIGKMHANIRWEMLKRDGFYSND